jgi:hypothetical protein
LLNDNGIDYEAVKAALITNQEVQGTWDGIIEKAVEKCRNFLNNERNGGNLVNKIASFENCIKTTFLENCVEFNEFQSYVPCYALAKYREMCPKKKFKLNNYYFCG